MPWMKQMRSAAEGGNKKGDQESLIATNVQYELCYDAFCRDLTRFASFLMYQDIVSMTILSTLTKRYISRFYYGEW